MTGVGRVAQAEQVAGVDEDRHRLVLVDRFAAKGVVGEVRDGTRLCSREEALVRRPLPIGWH
jgi:hypothetical protein